MKNFFGKISYLALFILLAITMIGYICPMSSGSSAVSKSSSAMCASTETAATQAGCVNMHLTIIAQLLGDIPHTMSSLLALILLVVLYNLFYRRLFITLDLILFSKLKRHYLYYQTSIKLLIEQRLLKYLNNLGNYTVVSFS